MKSHNTVPLQIGESGLFLETRGLFQGSGSGVVSTGLQGLEGVYCFRVVGFVTFVTALRVSKRQPPETGGALGQRAEGLGGEGAGSVGLGLWRQHRISLVDKCHRYPEYCSLLYYSKNLFLSVSYRL